MANENSIDVYHALMALEEKVTGTAPDPENVTTDVALALADIFRTDAPMAQETAIVNAIDTITANYGGGGGVTLGDINYTLLAQTADDPEPAVGGDVLGYGTLALSAGYIGDMIAAIMPSAIAAGMDAVTQPIDGEQPSFWLVTADENGEITAVETPTIDYTVETIGGDPYAKFTVPEGVEGKFLVVGTIGGGK